MKALLCAVALLFLTSISFAQNVYQIRADTVRIYNTCDTAELVLENRTRDTLGFLFNKGKGRTEFRRLHLLKIGSSKLAIVGQDTIDLDFAQYGDSAYVLKARTLTLAGGSGISITGGTQDLSANRTWTVTNTGVTSVNGATGAVTVAPASGSGNYIQNQTAADQPSSGFRITGLGRSNLQFQIVKDGSNSIVSAFQLFNAASTRGANIQLDGNTNPGLAFWVHDGTAWQNRLTLAANGSVGIGTATPIGGLHIVNNTSGIVLESTRAYASTSGGLFGAYNRGTPTGANQRLGGVIMGALTNGTEYRPSSQIDVLTSAAWTNDDSQPSYMRFMTTPEGAFQPVERMRIAADGTVKLFNIPALGTAGTNFLTSNGGVISSRTAAQVLADLGAAPASGSGNYIKNQQAAAQTENFWINGIGRTEGGRFLVQKNGSDTISAAFHLGNAALTNGANFQLTGGSVPGLGTWVHSGTAWVERMRIAPNGNIGIGLTAPTGKFEVANDSGVELQFSGANAANIYQATSAQPLYINSNTGPLYLGANGSGSRHITVLSNSNVGIGTTAPAYTLQVVGTFRTNGVADVGNTSMIRGSATGVANYAYMRFTDSAGTRVGYVGDPNNTANDIYLTSDSGSVRLVPKTGTGGHLNVQANTMDYNGGQLYLNNGTNNQLLFGTAGIDEPTFTTRSKGTKVILFPAVSASMVDYAMGIDTSHIWSSVPQNTGTVGFKWYGGTTQIARLDGKGNLTLSGQVQATSFVQTSLRSLKKDIQPFTTSALKVFEKVPVRTFKFKADASGKTNIGFIADEVPDEMATPQRNGVDQTSTVALLVKAVQELTEQNKALQQEIKEIKEQLKTKGMQQ